MVLDECRRVALARQAKAARIRHLLEEERLSTDEIARRMDLPESEVCRIIEQAGWS